jgi:Cu/Ag efflux pump CusA
VERDQGESSRLELLLHVTRERFAPTVTTSLTIALALAPLLLMGNIPGLEVLRPTAIVILSGLVTCTVVDLFVVPSLYLRFGKLEVALKK